jgi:subtilisin family serine protease
MASERYVVLRAPGRVARKGSEEVLGGAAGLPKVDVEVRIDTLDLTARDLRDAKRSPEVVGLAPIMPVMLVEPLEAAESAAAGQGDAAWGVKAVRALDSPFAGDGVSVAVLDTGIDNSHEAFKGKTIVQRDFTNEGDGDFNGHGTHCAGTVFGGSVGGFRIGVAPGISKAIVGKVLDRNGRGSSEQILAGVQWATAEGANVISMSIGLDFPGLVRRLTDAGMAIEPATSRALAAYRENVRLFDTLAALVKAQAMFTKTLIVAAAGNESKRPKYVIVTAPPAAADGIIAVGALEQSATALQIAPFSNGAPDLAAPGVAVPSAKVGGGLRSLSGTSMATPHVAGVAALWFQKVASVNPHFQLAQIESDLLGSAELSVIAPGQELADVGAGLVQAPRS